MRRSQRSVPSTAPQADVARVAARAGRFEEVSTGARDWACARARAPPAPIVGAAPASATAGRHAAADRCASSLRHRGLQLSATGGLVNTTAPTSGRSPRGSRQREARDGLDAARSAARVVPPPAATASAPSTRPRNVPGQSSHDRGSSGLRPWVSGSRRRRGSPAGQKRASDATAEAGSAQSTSASRLSGAARRWRARRLEDARPEPASTASASRS
jgi:hypothetical protein